MKLVRGRFSGSEAAPISIDPIAAASTDALDRAALEERSAELRRIVPPSPKSRLQFSEAIAGSGPDVFAEAEGMRLEGVVSKRVGSHCRSGRIDTCRKIKCWVESELILIGMELDKRTGAPACPPGRGSAATRWRRLVCPEDPQRGALRDRLAPSHCPKEGGPMSGQCERAF